MAKKNTEIANEEILQPVTEDPEPAGEPQEAEDEIVLSQETVDEIGSPDRDQVFLKVAKAYEDVRHTRENYKRIGPAFVFISGIGFLTLIFTLNNKITFLILWVVTVLVTAALMIRAEYKYHQFRQYLGLPEEEGGEEDEDEAQPDETGNEEQNKPQPDQPEQEKAQDTEQEEQA